MEDTSTYQQLLLQPEWKEKRATILERDHHQCKNCGSPKNLEIHHRQYHIESTTGQKKAPWQYENKYLITLCHRCHQAGHQHFQVPTFNL